MDKECENCVYFRACETCGYAKFINYNSLECNDFLNKKEDKYNG